MMLSVAGKFDYGSAGSAGNRRWAWLCNRLPAGDGLAYERSASLSGLAVAWLKEARARADPKSGMPATVLPPEDDEGAVDGSSDDRRRPAQGLAHRGGDRRGRGDAGRAAGACLGGPGRAARGVGGGLAGAHLGGRGRRRARLSARPAAGDRRRARARRAAQAGRPGAAAGDRGDEQDDPNDARSVAIAALRSTAPRR